ncbi:transcription factor 19-like [Coregonus clupeaformis]|uniref:transcription factor 19-like n=1 Tax=Coregonus clupeaformis TaxID=59861 RepID=UPI001E1C3EFE|nr:transcription factor 19-like [Coregonus clupeaformis]
MLSGVQPCFQLLRIGSSSTDSARDLYTFRPALTHSVFRLGRAEELCDVTLDSMSVSRIHAELHAEREAEGAAEGGWKVQINDRSSHGTWVNEVRLQPGVQWKLTDGDTLTFGGQSERGSPEFYFLFQKVSVRPLDFDAITIPKAGTFSSDLKNRIRTSLDRKVVANLDLSTLSINRATVILNSIGSLSKMNGTPWTFKRSDGNITDTSSTSLPLTSLVPPATPPPFPPTTYVALSKSLPPSSKSRRKSAHTVLLEDDSSDEARNQREVKDGPRGTKRRRLYKSESEGFHAHLPKTNQDVRRQFELKHVPVPKPIANCHTIVANGKLNHVSFNINQRWEIDPNNQRTVPNMNVSVFRQQKVFSPPSSGRGRRQAHSSPVYSPMVVGGESYTLASPSLRICKEESGRAGQFGRFHITSGKRRGRPRKHPPPRPSLPPPSSSSSSSSSSSEDEVEGVSQGVEPCAAPRCRLPQQDTVQWVQCDDCDAWYHLDCLHCERKNLLLDPNADFHCGCR